MAAVGVLAATAWLLRRPLFEATLCRRIETILAEALCGEVEVRALRGDWLRTVVAEGVTLREGTGLVRRIESATVEARYSLLGLLRGDPEALVWARLEARRVDLVAPRGGTGGGGTPPDWSALASLLPAGASVQVDACSLGEGDTAWIGPLRVTLAPGGGPRRATVRWAGVAVDAQLVPGEPALEAALRIDGLDGLLRAVGVSGPLQGGQVEGTLRWQLATGVIDGRLALDGARAVALDGARAVGLDAARAVARDARLSIAGRFADGRLSLATLDAQVGDTTLVGRQVQLSLAALADDPSAWRSIDARFVLDASDLAAWTDVLPQFEPWLRGKARIEGRLAAGVLACQTARFDPPGGSVVATELRLPIVDALLATDARQWLAEAAAAITVEVDDLAPWADRLPASTEPWRAARGKLRAVLAAGKLTLEDSVLREADTQLRVTGGVLGLDGEGSVTVSLRAAEPRTLDLPGVGRLHLSGECVVTLHGPLAAPRAEGRLALTGIEHERIELGALGAQLRYADRTLELSELTIERAGRPGAPGGGTLRGTVRLELAGGEREVPRVELDVAGRFDPAVLPAELGAVAAVAPFDFDLRGRVDLASGLPLGGAVARLRGVRWHEAPALDVELDCEVGGGEPARELRLRGLAAMLAGQGEVVLWAHGRWPLAGSAAVDAEVALRDVDLAPWAPHLGLLGLDGQATLHAALRGDRRDPEIAAQLEGQLRSGLAGLPIRWPEVLGPPAGGPIDAHLSLAGRASAPELRALRIATAESDAIEIAGGGELPIAFVDGIIGRKPASPLVVEVALRAPQAVPGATALLGTVVVDESRLRLDPLVLRTPQGEVLGSMAVAAAPHDLLADTQRLSDAALSAEAVFTGVALDALPFAESAVPGLAGRASGSLRLSGTLGQPRPEIDVRLFDFAVRPRGLQRIEKGAGRIRLTPHRIDIDDLQAEMGSGRVEAKGHLASERPLWDDPLAAAVDLQLTARDALFVRGDGLAVRGDADLRARSSGARIDVTGHVRATSGRYVRRISTMPDLRARGGLAAGERGFVPFEIEGRLGERLVFDVALGTARPLELRTGLCDLDVDATLRLRGRGNRPYLVGTVTGSDGTIRLPGTSFRTESVLVRSGEDAPHVPRVELLATGRRLGYRVQMMVKGDYDQPEVRLSSVPPLPPEDLAVLVGTGRMPKDLRDEGLRGSASVLGSYAAGEVIAYLFGSESTESQESIAERLTIESGYEVSKNGLEAIRAEILVLPRLAVEAERDVYEDYNVGLVLRLRF